MEKKYSPHANPSIDCQTVRLPSPFWDAIRMNVLSVQAAQMEWARQLAAGNPHGFYVSDSTE